MPTSAAPQPVWRLASFDAEAAARLRAELSIGPLLARLLAIRGFVEPADAERYLSPALEHLHPPELLPDFAPARDVLLAAMERREPIFVHGDYDVDGVTSTALLARFLRSLGCTVETHIPHRIAEGYGVHDGAVDAAREWGAKVFLTCDCGTNAIAQVERARAAGMRVVVTDHHELGEHLPAADAVVNPHRPDSAYPFSDLSGVGVAFKLCLGLTKALGHSEERFARAFLDLAALGTIADVMPLVGENRVLASLGLVQLAQTRKVGLRTLLDLVKLREGSPVTSTDVGFRIGPRLNATGRVDDARIALELLLVSDPAVARRLADEVDAKNRERRDAQAKALEEAEAQVLADAGGPRRFLVAASESWHPGIVGIVAGRLAERFHRPSLVAAIDAATGMCRSSARSIPGFNLVAAINAFPELLTGGGHAAAAGCSFALADLEAVRAALDGYAAAQLDPASLAPTCEIDAELELGEVSVEALDELARMQPFGRENPEPLFAFPRLALVAQRATRDGKHAQSSWRGGDGGVLEAIAFNMADRFAELAPGDVRTVLAQPQIDEYNGRRKAKLVVRDYRD